MTTEQQISDINSKLDLLLEHMQERRQQQEQVDDLLADVGFIAKDFSDTAIRRLEHAGVEMEQEMISASQYGQHQQPARPGGKCRRSC
jgi:hypothetical protein